MNIVCLIIGHYWIYSHFHKFRKCLRCSKEQELHFYSNHTSEWK